ncbi:hypothetical protein SDRG_07514 [Saprolegnia diclina VS20]|uniref:peptidylprolyl isomerase n=1 Tax=Saprolegnia diclina (strain VS20) TaxID=1156394 RepID=T0QBK4_SAPDV|nr:hypothetical protein SDRG_07514 [Saprolegnia diclina VS20]EQC35289.1 hypothetical protein SDRG_07514 [Saprolegnia diclina VS20]|eukprot:XP_008611573.1 hypothetical protein SDRG_07514 [Saprolegnia diclina VS20]
MVLVRRKDNRKGNEADSLDVISSNKGVRSMNNSMTGRFAADMRVRVGGYGRPDQTWGVDHPWHKTGEADLFQMISAKDKMEDGVLLKEQPKSEAKGLSRASLKRKKKQQKKGGAPVPEDTAAEPEADDQEEKAAPTPTKKKSLFDDSDDEDDEPKPVAKKAKVEGKKPEPKKQEPKKKAAKKDDNLNKREKKKAELEKQAAQEDLKMLVTEAPKSFVEPLDVREALAAEYEAKTGVEITTPSGITLRDLSIGRGKLPTPGQMLTVRYRGCIGSKGGAIFGKGMLTMKFGEGAVIPGWEEGMATMRASGKRHLTIPPELAYGAAGKGDKIPPNSTLFFDVELVRIGLRQRDAITEADVPLPKSFVRKRVEKKESEKQPTAAPADAKKKKPKRIKY